jgi:hypothetical protein
MSHKSKVKDAPYFSHDSNATADPKMAALLLRYGMAGYGRWWRLIEMLREQRDYRLPLNTCSVAALAKVWDLDLTEATAFMEWLVSDDVKLIATDGSVYWSDRLDRDMERLDEIRNQRRASGTRGADKRWHRNSTAIAALKRGHDDTIVDDSPSFLPSGCHLKDGTTEEVPTSSGDVSPPSSAAAPLAGAPPAVGDVLPSFVKINPHASVESHDEPALNALLALHGAEAVVAAYRAQQQHRPGRSVHWFVVDFARYRAMAAEGPPAIARLPPSMEERLVEREREEAEHPELVAEAEAKAAELKAKMHAAPSTDDDWEATAPKEETDVHG